MRGYCSVTRDGKRYKAQELEREPNYSFYKNVHYQGKQVALEVAGTEVVLTQKSNAKRSKGRYTPLKAKMNCVRLKTVGKTMAPWILLTNTGITAREAAQYDYYRWRIESYCKLLKSAGYRGDRQRRGVRLPPLRSWKGCLNYCQHKNYWSL